MLTGTHSSGANAEAGVRKVSILGPLFFLIYINDLSNGSIFIPKLFADYTSSFSIVHDVNLAVNNLNNDLIKMSKWALQWKINFNPDPLKQAQEVSFIRKTKQINHPPLF